MRAIANKRASNRIGNPCRAGRGGTIDENRSGADGLDSAASTFTTGRTNCRAAGRFETLARQSIVRTGGLYAHSRCQTDDGRRGNIVNKNPGPALTVAVAFGFIVGRAFSRDWWTEERGGTNG